MRLVRGGKESYGVSYVTPTGVEPVIPGMKTLCPRPLDEGAMK